jgi:hypothetical protein
MGNSHFEIPEARVDDLDLDDPSDRAKWEQRLAQLAEGRLQTARRRLEQMGVITPDGDLVSDEVPADMTPGSEASVDTG